MRPHSHPHRIVARSLPVQLASLCLIAASADAQAGGLLEPNLSGTEGTWQHFEVEIPAGTPVLTVQLSGGTADADLYVRAVEQPTVDEYDCAPFLVTNDETCELTNPAPGIFRIGVRAYTDFEGATLQISWPVAETIDTNGPALDAPPAIDVNADAALPPAASVWVERHNLHRAKHCAAPVTWDPEIAASAQAWADGCVFEHAQGTGLGENLFGNTGAVDIPAAVDGWYSEVAQYDFANPGFTPGTGHFTQVVWRATTRIGCGVAMCPGLFTGFSDSLLYVCRYAPPGNNTGPGQFEANVVLEGNACE